MNLLPLVIILLVNSFSGSNVIEHQEFKAYFDKENVKGSFVLYDEQNNTYHTFDSASCRKRYTPASTFKILNSLIGLESGVISGKDYLIKWNGRKYSIDEWNKDHTLESAIKVSCVPYFQELARRVGKEKMQEYISKAKYGNCDISGGIDRFWLSGGLRITPLEQVQFLRRFYHNEIGFSPKNIETVKEIILLEETDDYKLYGKTGWGRQRGFNIGWFVGFVESGGKVYYFATDIQKKKGGKHFSQSRMDITYRILSKLDLI